MTAWLICDGCGTRQGPLHTYEEWEDTARKLGWHVGEEVVLCATCSGH